MKQFVVLGLGVFGATVARTLSSYDCEVLAIDNDHEHVEQLAEDVTRAVIGDITDMEFLKELGVGEFDVGIVAIGNHLEDSILAVMNLKELGVKHIIAKAQNKRFEDVLLKVGADRVVRPEKEMGEKVARSLLRNNITDLIPLDEDYSVVEMKVPFSWVGKSLSHLNLRKKYNINIIAKRDQFSHKLEFFVDPNERVKQGDVFLVVADTEKIEEFDYK